jgi:amino acid transporter
MEKNRFLPETAARVHQGSGIPRRALVINFVIGLAFLLPRHSWQSIVAATSALSLIAYALPAIAAVAFQHAAPSAEAGRRTPDWMRYLAPTVFVLASLILYWATWKELRIALPVLLVGVIVYGYQQWRDGVDWQDVRLGARLVGYLAAHPAPEPLLTPGPAR